MKKMIPITAFLSVVIMMTACGEGFKATLKDSKSQQANQGAEDINNAAPPEAARSVYENIAMSYESDFANLNQSKIQSLTSSIKSFEVEVKYTSHPGGGSDVLQSINAKLKLDCLQSTMNFSTTASNMTALKAMQRITVGTMSSHQVKLQCVDAGCREIVASVKRTSAGNEGIVLLNLGRTNTTVSNGVTTEKYQVKAAPIATIFMYVIDLNTFVARCLQNINNQPLSTTVDPTGNTASTNAFGTSGSTSTNAFGTSSTYTAPVWNYDATGAF
jgi:hypothetical protein